MQRINLMLALLVGFGVAGCAQCDTCDDFPTPCVGPNCGQAYGVPGEMMSQGSPVMGTSTPLMPPGADSAGPAPSMPAPSMPPAEPASPPQPMAMPG